MPKLDIEAIPQSNGTGYPEPFAKAVEGRWWRRIAPAGGLTEMGASHVVLKPGAWSSQRHWHAAEDELLVMLTGEAVLVEDDCETLLRPGHVCAWAKGIANGHHLQNRSDADCSFIAISAGDREKDAGDYPDIDMIWTSDGLYRRKDGTPYETERPA